MPRGSLQGRFTFSEPTQGFVELGPDMNQLPGWQRARGWELLLLLLRGEEAERALAWLLPSPMPQHRCPWGRGEAARLLPAEQFGFRLRRDLPPSR